PEKLVGCFSPLRIHHGNYWRNRLCTASSGRAVASRACCCPCARSREQSGTHGFDLLRRAYRGIPRRGTHRRRRVFPVDLSWRLHRHPHGLCCRVVPLLPSRTFGSCHVLGCTSGLGTTACPPRGQSSSESL